MKKLIVRSVRGLMVLLSKLPLKFHYFMGDILSWIAKNIIRYRTDVVWINISRSFPDMRYSQLKEVFDGFYKHFGEIFAEAIWFAGATYRRLYDSGIVEVTNPGTLSEMFENSPSLTVLSTHCGNWELMGGFLGYRTSDGTGYSFDEEEIRVVYKKLSSDIADEIFARNRVAALERVGTTCEIESSNILRYSIRNRDKKLVYIYPTDQAPYRGTGRYDMGEFMNQQTYAMTGSVGVACKLSHAVIYMKMRRVERGKYLMSFIPICQNASEYTPEEIMRKYYDILEEEIRETPSNWLWTHKRWK